MHLKVSMYCRIQLIAIKITHCNDCDGVSPPFQCLNPGVLASWESLLRTVRKKRRKQIRKEHEQKWIELVTPECIEGFIDNQDFSRSYYLAPPPPSPPLTPSESVSKLDRRHTRRLRKRNNLLTGEKGEGGGEGAKSYESKKVWFFINHKFSLY
jgi:hypothetical protein